MKLTKLVFETKYFARGTFTKAYLSTNKKNVKLVSSCPAKECFALGWCGDSSFFSKIERIEYEVYVLPYYPRVGSLKRSLKPLHYKLYQELRSLREYNGRNYNELREHWIKQFSTISNERLRDALCEALDGLGNYGLDFGFEISPRNVAVKNGNLILLDCFFKVSSLLARKPYLR